MTQISGYYSVIQFGARPSRFEFVNVGVMIFEPAAPAMRLRMTPRAHRVRRLFEDENEENFLLMAQSFAERIRYEYRASPSLQHLTKFIESRVNLFRMTPLKPMFIDDLEVDIDRMFADMVADDGQG